MGESQSNDDIENGVTQVQGQFRTIRASIQLTYKQNINEDAEVLGWLVPPAAHSSHRYLVGPDGRTPRQRLKGRSFTQDGVQFGEWVWYLMPKSVGINKLHTRWKAGIWLGNREGSGETIVGTTEGCIKVRSIRRSAGSLK